jgi:hypothetical protein
MPFLQRTGEGRIDTIDDSSPPPISAEGVTDGVHGHAMGQQLVARQKSVLRRGQLNELVGHPHAVHRGRTLTTPSSGHVGSVGGSGQPPGRLWRDATGYAGARAHPPVEPRDGPPLRPCVIDVRFEGWIE